MPGLIPSFFASGVPEYPAVIRSLSPADREVESPSQRGSLHRTPVADCHRLSGDPQRRFGGGWRVYSCPVKIIVRHDAPKMHHAARKRRYNERLADDTPRAVGQ